MTPEIASKNEKSRKILALKDRKEGSQRNGLKSRGCEKDKSNSKGNKKGNFGRKHGGLMPTPYGDPLGLYAELGVQVPFATAYTPKSDWWTVQEKSHEKESQIVQHSDYSSENLEAKFQKMDLKSKNASSHRTPLRSIENIAMDEGHELRSWSRGYAGSEQSDISPIQQKFVMDEFEALNPTPDCGPNGNVGGPLSPVFLME